MLNPWLLLGSVAFVVSFGLGFLLTGDLGSSLMTGSMALGTALITAGAVNWYHNRAADSRLAALKHQIRLLQRRRTEEQQAVFEMTAEKERVAQTLDSMQTQLRQFQLPGSSPLAPKALSWDLNHPPSPIELGPDDFMPPVAAPTYAAPTPPAPSYGVPPQGDGGLNQFLAEAAATKQKIVASLNHLQAELGQLNGQIAEQRQVRERLSQEINALTQQKQKLAASSKSLKAEVDELERCRIEVDQYLAYVETKKKELETGANPLQKALKQLQGQVTALQEELRQLEAQVTAKRQEKEVLDRAIATSQPTQNQARSLQETLQKLENKIADRRQEKESLERQITQLQAQKTALRNQPEATPPELVRPTPPKKASASPPVADRGNGKAAPSLNPKGMAASQQAAVPLPREEEEETQDLSDLWTDFMVQLSDYEFQALRAIAEEGSPLPILTQLAEESFTSTDELVDAINQRAQEILGEAIIKPQTGFSPPTIVRNQQRTIRKMIETYEYLTE